MSGGGVHDTPDPYGPAGSPDGVSADVPRSAATSSVGGEAGLEGYVLDILGELAWQHVPGVELGPKRGVRADWRDLVLYPRLRKNLAARYPYLSEDAREDAIKALLRTATRNDVAESHRFHQRLTGGVSVPYPDPATGEERYARVRPVDFADPYGNDLVAASQVRAVDVKDRVYVFDIVLYVNGLPLAITELKRPEGEDDTRTAYDQIQGYRRELKGTGAFRTILMALATDGVTARLGTPFTSWQHMAPWHADDDGRLLRREERQDGRDLERMLFGAFAPSRFLDLAAHFLSYSAPERGSVDAVKLAKVHQYLAVNTAVHASEAAVATDGRAGVVWHTQGAGKSEEMLFYVAKAARMPELSNPTFVVLTDRIDLDDQLYRVFAASRTLSAAIGGDLEKARDTGHLRELLTRPQSNGGVIFATLQKFRLSPEERRARVRHPLVSPRRDVIVVVDEAHRGHYDFIDGYARNLRDALPHATFIAFTGTPIDNRTGSTRGVFGDDIHTYDLTQAVDDGATVPVFYEPHLVKVDLLPDADLDELDARAEGLVEGLSDVERRKARAEYGRLEDVIAAPGRIEELAQGLLKHWDARRAEMLKLTGFSGKAMVVCASRRIAARLFEAVARRRPEWTGQPDSDGRYDDRSGRIRVVYTGNTAQDPDDVAPYVRSPGELKEIQQRVVDEHDELEVVIVQSLWLTGFDAPPLHTLYLDRRMRGATLMQAIARVNRTWPGKPSGLVVDFQGVIRELKAALAEYSEPDRERRTLGTDLGEAVKLVRECHQRVEDTLQGCPWREWLTSGRPHAYREALTGVLEFLERPEPPKARAGRASRRDRFAHWTDRLRDAFSVCPQHRNVQDLLEDIRFFEAVRTTLRKFAVEEKQEQGIATATDVRLVIAQLNQSVIASDGVVDIYQAAGLTRPDLSHLDPAVLADLKTGPYPNLAIQALRRKLLQEIKEAHPRNLTRQKAFTEKVREAMNRYVNGLISAAEFMDFLVKLARDVSQDRDRARSLDITEDELAFYDALTADPSVLEMMDGNLLARIAHELYDQISRDVTVDWRHKEQARDRIMARVLRLLRKHGYPPDHRPAAVERVLRQAEEMADSLA